jgi:LysR family transcriptional regulator of gallate degradation
MTRGPDPSPDLTRQLDNLRVLIAVAETQRVAAASEQIIKARSAVSRSISELERATGAILFERVPRGMKITAYGKAVMVRALRVQAEFRLAFDDLRRLLGAAQISSSAFANLFSRGRRLQLLIQLADFRRTSAAAAKLDVTPDGVRLALARMEAALGQPLFRRHLEGLIPTELADRLIVLARRVFSELRHLRSDIDAISGRLAGTVVIGTTPLGRKRFWPKAIAAALARHPGLCISTVESAHDDLVTKLHGGELDIVFGLLRPVERDAGLISEPLFTDHLGVVVRARHPLRPQRHVKWSDLQGERWILPGAKAFGRQLLDQVFQEAGLKTPTPAVETGDYTVIRELLLEGDFLAVVSLQLLEQELKAESLVQLPLSLGGPTRDVGFMVRDGTLLSPAALAVLDSVRTQICGATRRGSGAGRTTGSSR